MTRMSIKVYVHYKEDSHPEKTSKLSIPGSWSSRPVSDVIGLFLKPYNDKNPDHFLEVSQVHLETVTGTSIYSNATVTETLGDHSDYFIKPGVFVRGPDDLKKAVDSRPRCKNYGCNKYFIEDENTDSCCHHHVGPPVFHDTVKFWSCCPDKKAYDFDTFQAVVGCAVGKHSTVSKVTLGPSPNATGESSAPASVLKSIEEYNSKNEDGVTAADSAIKTLQTERKSSRKEDGTARCQRKGCQKVFNWMENASDACKYHKGSAIFHDAIKFWSCCPEKKCFDFDEFLLVPGCEVGYHDDGVIDL